MVLLPKLTSTTLKNQESATILKLTCNLRQLRTHLKVFLGYGCGGEITINPAKKIKRCDAECR